MVNIYHKIKFLNLQFPKIQKKKKVAMNFMSAKRIKRVFSKPLNYLLTGNSQSNLTLVLFCPSC